MAHDDMAEDDRDLRHGKTIQYKNKYKMKLFVKTDEEWAEVILQEKKKEDAADQAMARQQNIIDILYDVIDDIIDEDK